MNNLIRKGVLALLVVLVALIVYLFNRPRPVAVDNLYSQSDVGVLMTGQTGDQDSGAIGYDKHIENDFLALYVDDDSSRFAIKDKRNDFTWYSSNTRNDPLIRTASVRNLQRSTFQISYLQKDGTVATMNNYEYSIAYKRDFEDSFVLDYNDDGITVTYTLRDREPKGYWFPAYISADRFTELVLTPVQLAGSQMDLRNLLDYYAPMEEDPDTYVIRQLIRDEETNEFDMTTLSGAQVETLFKLFYEIGHYGNKTDGDGNYIEEYHLDDVAFDNEQYGIIINYDQPEFVVPMDVILNEDNVEVKINYYEIEERNGFELVAIRLLPYFGAQRNDTDGYLVIPEGSGGLIRFNNGKSASKSYSSYIYGMDNTEIPEKMTARDVGARMPIFGIKAPANAMMGIIESGISHSRVTADVSGKFDSYNKIYNEFIFKQSGSYRLAENTVQLWTEQDYTYSPAVKYYFFAEDDANYASMAHLFGDYLAQKFRLDALDDKRYRLYLEFLGSYDYDSFFLWFPTNETASLTTYEQATAIIDELRAAGVEDQLIRYVGWFNGGIEHSVPDDINLDNAVGGRRDLRDFLAHLEELGYPVFFDVDFVKTYSSGSFYSSRNYARVIGGNVSRYYEYSTSSQLPDPLSDPYYLSNVPAIDRNTTRFERDAARLGLPGISFRNLGDMIYSDYKINDLLPREFVTIYYQDILAKFYTYDTMVEGGNMYALALTRYLTDVEARTSNLVVVDEAIPFYQIAVAPYVDYSLQAFNFGDVYAQDEYLLKALETGSNLKAMISHDDTSELMYTDFNEYYSVAYDNNKDDIIAMSLAHQAIGLNGSHVIDHQILAPGVVLVTYSSDRTFVINYNDTVYDPDDLAVPARSYEEVE